MLETGKIGKKKNVSRKTSKRLKYRYNHYSLVNSNKKIAKKLNSDIPCDSDENINKNKKKLIIPSKYLKDLPKRKLKTASSTRREPKSQNNYKTPQNFLKTPPYKLLKQNQFKFHMNTRNSHLNPSQTTLHSKYEQNRRKVIYQRLVKNDSVVSLKISDEELRGKESQLNYIKTIISENKRKRKRKPKKDLLIGVMPKGIKPLKDCILINPTPANGFTPDGVKRERFRACDSLIQSEYKDLPACRLVMQTIGSPVIYKNDSLSNTINESLKNFRRQAEKFTPFSFKSVKKRNSSALYKKHNPNLSNYTLNLEVPSQSLPQNSYTSMNTSHSKDPLPRPSKLYRPSSKILTRRQFSLSNSRF
ncbi:unnamed protein product [Moneuplotes crassus]|uniref:Uncharacterized protein n=1 Tax=Euplotes crassus TaxID=5936 RepID=A0AAD1U8K3_EUPCR|nr:unnamed protein product [Moneuplotes crassus]